MHDDECGMIGAANDQVRVGEFNRLWGNLFKNHMNPIEERLKMIEKLLDEEEIIHAKIAGGVMALRFMAVIIFGAIVSTAGVVVWAMQKAGAF